MSATRLSTNETEREAPPVPRPLNIGSLQQRVAEMAAEAAEAEQAAPPTEEQQRQAAADAVTQQLAILGFPVENWEPEWERLPQDWQGRASAYLSSLPDYIEQGMGMMASSRTGGGKTSLLALIARAAAKHNIDCAYCLNGRTLLYQIALVDRRQQTRAGAYDALGEDLDLEKRWPHQDTPLLLLDDIDYIPGAGYDPERDGWDTIGAFLYARMASGRATCLATNLPIVTVGQTVGLLDKPGMGRVADRATVYLPESLRVITARPTQRGE